MTYRISRIIEGMKSDRSDIESVTSNGREATQAILKMDEAIMWLEALIRKEEDQDGEDES